MGCEPHGPPFADYMEEFRHILCVAYMAAEGDCCDLFPPSGDNDDVENANALTVRYRAHRDGGGFSDPQDAATYLSLMNDLENLVNSPQSSISQEAKDVLTALIAEARNDLGAAPGGGGA